MRREIIKQIKHITSQLISVGLSIDQVYPSDNRNKEIYISGKHDLSIVLKNISYTEIYNILEKDRNYNIKMIDGALVQLMYSFDSNDKLRKYRLGFFPSPNLEEFQNSSEIYDDDELYADIIDKNIVSVPIRFDCDYDNYEVQSHPKSHVTLGQYKNCRIPLNIPITPNIFIDFILRNFYNTAKNKFSNELNFDLKSIFEETIHEDEEKILHFSINVL